MTFSFRFFRFIRKHARPIEPNKALRWKNRLNIMYIFFAWNGVGLVAYYHFFGKGKTAKVPDNSAESWAKFLKLDDTVTIVKMKGLTSVEKYDYTVPKEENPQETIPQQDAEQLPQ